MEEQSLTPTRGRIRSRASQIPLAHGEVEEGPDDRPQKRTRYTRCNQVGECRICGCTPSVVLSIEKTSGHKFILRFYFPDDYIKINNSEESFSRGDIVSVRDPVADEPQRLVRVYILYILKPLGHHPAVDFIGIDINSPGRASVYKLLKLYNIDGAKSISHSRGELVGTLLRAKHSVAALVDHRNSQDLFDLSHGDLLVRPFHVLGHDLEAIEASWVDDDDASERSSRPPVTRATASTTSQPTAEAPFIHCLVRQPPLEPQRIRKERTRLACLEYFVEWRGNQHPPSWVSAAMVHGLDTVLALWQYERSQ